MGLLDVYYYVNDEIADWRTNNWFLVSSPLPITFLTFAYLYFVLKCGPRYMEGRPAYKLYRFIRLYNIFQIVSNAMIIYATIEAGWYKDYFIYCVKVDFTDSPQAMKFASISWYLLLLKIIDYIETGMFVLRKKQRQVSFLHLYHHVSTAWLAWAHIKYFTSGISLILPIVNCAVHVLMYTYYLLSSIKSLEKTMYSVKHFITITQMVSIETEYEGV
ncbi:elongation of very long chain fatty acids protein 7-like [Ceratina calcarata]|uniref:Elongation of very long chain fatty acids protein n=1 Tax=Ceratina calcarata TaxID=156304 RepID=A0AAJ7W8W4_9HYME|nr:elongation of very long chain fatty acids protein 7-like [Ceratina calcarata]